MVYTINNSRISKKSTQLISTGWIRLHQSPVCVQNELAITAAFTDTDKGSLVTIRLLCWWQDTFDLAIRKRTWAIDWGSHTRERIGTQIVGALFGKVYFLVGLFSLLLLLLLPLLREELIEKRRRR